jgi:hypothetical protein
MLDIDNLIETGVQTTQEMEVKKGKNRNAKEISFEIDGHTYMLDSQEEWCMFNWIKEMKERGLLLDYVYQPEHYDLSPRYEYTPYPVQTDKNGEFKKKFLMHPHVYTADFILRFDARNLQLIRYLAQAFKIRLDDVKDNELTLVVDVKGTFMSNDGGRSFSINQKMMMAVHNIYVQKFVPKVAFKKLGVPKRCTTTMKSGKASKVFKGMNFMETVLKGFDV